MSETMISSDDLVATTLGCFFIIFMILLVLLGIGAVILVWKHVLT